MKVMCPHCARVFTAEQWECLEWLQYVGVGRGRGGTLRGAEVRRCVCTTPVLLERVLPVAREVVPA